MKPVVIIGAGIVGVSTAIWLQRKGIDVVLVDKGGPASGASYGNAGVLAAASVVPVTVPGLIGKAPKMLLDKSQHHVLSTQNHVVGAYPTQSYRHQNDFYFDRHKRSPRQ